METHTGYHREKGQRDGPLSPWISRLSLAFVPAALALVALHSAVTPPARLPDLFVAGITAVSAGMFVLAYLYFAAIAPAAMAEREGVGRVKLE